KNWVKTVKVNLDGVYLVTKGLMEPMVKKGYGRVINIASQAGRSRPVVADSAYAATKAGVIGFTRALAEEMGEHGITANCVAPGRVETEMVRIAGAATNQGYINRVPLQRLGSPWEIAAA